MKLLRGNPAVLPQLLLNLCVVSLATCNKLFEIFAPGEKVYPRINVRTGNQTTSWLFDTGAAITCMNSWLLNAAFGSQKPKKISNAQSCLAASSDVMTSIGIYKVDLWIKGWKFTHPINVITQLNDNIIGIDFMHQNKSIYDVNTSQVKFADSHLNTICASKQVTVPAMTFEHHNGEIQRRNTPRKNIPTIHCPSTPTISGVPALVSMDENNNCKIMIEICAPLTL